MSLFFSEFPMISCRFHNELTEVKQQKEEKAKQDACAQSREREKDFISEQGPLQSFMSKVQYNC